MLTTLKYIVYGLYHMSYDTCHRVTIQVNRLIYGHINEADEKHE